MVFSLQCQATGLLAPISPTRMMQQQSFNRHWVTCPLTVTVTVSVTLGCTINNSIPQACIYSSMGILCLCKPVVFIKLPAPCSFPGEIWTHLVPQSVMSLLHLLSSSLWLLTAFPVTQDLSLKSQWNYPWVQSSLVRPRNPSPGKIFNFLPITHRGWGDRSVPFTEKPMISFSLPVQTVMKTKSASVSHAALPWWVKVTQGGWN